MPSPTASFRLRPRWPWLPWALGGFGALVLAFSLLAGLGPTTRVVQAALAAAIIAAAVTYARSPLWRSAVIVDDDGLRVEGPRGRRLELLWRDVVRVRAADGNQSCYVDVGEPAKNFLLPGPGMAVPYRIERAGELYARITAACAGKLEKVEDVARKPPAKEPKST